ncbi:MAG TPA: hypothetical protein EYM78_06610 [Gemmatimonadetes bacterium]|nr:hypothetical protein [Gemmatimonadota bacterium]
MRRRVGPWANAKDRAVDGAVAREVQALGITSDDLPPVRGIGFVSAREMPHDIGEDAVLGTDTPAVRAANKLLREALLSRASDIHLEDHLTGLRLRYRVDGILRDHDAPPPELRAATGQDRNSVLVR